MPRTWFRSHCTVCCGWTKGYGSGSHLGVQMLGPELFMPITNLIFEGAIVAGRMLPPKGPGCRVASLSIHHISVLVREKVLRDGGVTLTSSSTPLGSFLSCFSFLLGHAGVMRPHRHLVAAVVHWLVTGACPGLS